MLDFIEQKGLYEYNINIVLDQMRNPTYVNPLRRQMVMYQQPQFAGSQVQQPLQRQPGLMSGQPVMMPGQPMPGQPMAGQMYGQNVMMNTMAMGMQQRVQQQ